MKKIFAIILAIMLVSSIVSAHGDKLEHGEELVTSKIDCEQLKDEQLEAIGDYYMEQMHPGEAHERMDNRMGGEGSETLRLMHIRLARAFYCGNHEVMETGMMGMMMGGGMMSSTGSGQNMMSNNAKMGYGMMGNYFFGHSWWGTIWMIIIWSLVIWLAFWIVSMYSKKSRPESALDILRKRFAKGQITKKQFDDMKNNLS